jgi:hypothetical protein
MIMGGEHGPECTLKSVLADVSLRPRHLVLAMVGGFLNYPLRGRGAYWILLRHMFKELTFIFLLIDN